MIIITNNKDRVHELHVMNLCYVLCCTCYCADMLLKVCNLCHCERPAARQTSLTHTKIYYAVRTTNILNFGCLIPIITAASVLLSNKHDDERSRALTVKCDAVISYMCR